MGTVCELARVRDETIDWLLNSETLVDNFIDNEFHLSDARFFQVQSYHFSIDKAWDNIQFGLYPYYRTDPSHILSKAIANAHKFEKTDDRRATYLYAAEVAELWLILREITTEMFLSNLNQVINNAELIAEWDYNLVAENEKEKINILEYALFHFVTFVSAFYAAWIHKNGLLIFYS